MRKSILFLMLASVVVTYSQKNAKDSKKESEKKTEEIKTKVVEVENYVEEASKNKKLAPSATVPSMSTEGYAAVVKNPFEIGISGGLHAIWGDLSSNIGLNLNNSTFGLHVRKAFSHHFSMRLQYNYGTATSRALQPRYTAYLNSDQANQIGVNPGLGASITNNLWFAASQTYSHSLSLDQIFTIGNTSIYRNRPNFIFNLFVGPTLMLYRTKLNLKDNNSPGNPAYNFSNWETIYSSAITSNPINGAQAAKEAIAREMDNMDDSYETLAINNQAKPMIFGMALIPAISFGAGVQTRISDKFNLGLDQRFIYAFDDYLDGERYHVVAGPTGNSYSFSQNNDIVMNTTLSLNYNLAKNGEVPKYWRNENDYFIKKLAGSDNKKMIQDAFEDEDGDGVPNKLDQQEDSRAGCPVDTRGVMLDSDKDGILDCDDEEPYSPAGYPVDAKGKAIVPPPACCEEMKNRPAVPYEQKNTTNPACAESSIPSVRFAKDKFGITPDIAAALKAIGEKMQACPDMKLVVAGVNDKNTANGKYNEQLSYNRATEVTTHLSENYGLSRDRFIVKFNQEGIGDKNIDRAVMFRHAQSGEYGNSNPPSPHPGLKAGSKY